jgi:hypothetical protein
LVFVILSESSSTRVNDSSNKRMPFALFVSDVCLSHFDNSKSGLTVGLPCYL